jgi:DNA-binding transcriptional LysR family regulator
MELRHLRYFCGVAEHKSFSRAAAKLRVAQPSLSRQIKDLENELGVELFIRSSVGVSLTDAGEALYQQTTKILSHLAIAVSTVQEIGKGKGGSFVIGGDWRLPLDVLPQAVVEIRQLFPKVEVSLSDLPMHEHMMALRERRIHIGFVPQLYFGAGDGVESQKILSTDIVAILPKNHPLAGAKRLRLADLEDDIWILGNETASPGVRSYYTQLFRLAQISPKFGPPASTVRGLVARISAGDGVSLVPRTLISDRGPPIALVPADVEPFELFAVWPSEGASPLVHPFLKTLVEHLNAFKTVS